MLGMDGAGAFTHIALEFSRAFTTVVALAIADFAFDGAISSAFRTVLHFA
jgi:hypothetical protein